MTDSLDLVTLSTKCLAVGVLLRSIEVLINWREWPEGRLFGWRIRSTRTGFIARLWQAVSTPSAALVVTIVRISAAAACLWVPLAALAMPWLLGCLVATQVYWSRRFRSIGQGSDTMFLIGLAAVFTASLDPADAHLRAIALTFLALQTQVAYLAAGLDKIRSPAWRDGRRLTAAFEAGPWRQNHVGQLLNARPMIAVAGSWYVILLELTLSVTSLLPAPAFQVVFTLGLLFHVSIALLMGLNGFLWSFGAAYPGIYFVHQFLWRN